MQYPQRFQSFQTALSTQRLSHAYVFSGIPGMGKTAFAEQLARWLLCKTQNPNESCDCRTCKQFSAGSHPDFLYIAPAEKNHSIKIEQVRTLSEQLSRSSHHGGYRVVLIAPADAMPLNAANALLKTLEEPPEKVIFFLIDNQKHALPSTILSRCQIIYFDENALKIQLQQQDASLRNTIIDHLLQLQTPGIHPIAPAITWAKYPLSDVLDIFLLICADLGRIQQSVSHHHLLYPDAQTALKKIAQQISPKNLNTFTATLFEKKQHVANGINLNAQLCLEALLMHLHTTITAHLHG